MANKQGLICVSLGVTALAEALQLMGRLATAADVVEIRLDCLDDGDPLPFLACTEVPLLFTNRPAWEGGRFHGEESARIEPLVRAAANGASYIDCEMRAPESSRQVLRDTTAESGSRLILSWHDYFATPSWSELCSIVKQLHRQGGDIGKIVTMAHDHFDVLRVLRLQEEAAAASFPLIAFCMGRPGMISRLATLELGGYMTYCAAAPGSGTAPGQLHLERMRALLDLFSR